MTIAVEFIIALILTGFTAYEFIRINLFQRDGNALLAGLSAVLSLGFGAYLWMKNGLLLDYGTATEIAANWAGLMWFIGVVSLLTGLVFLLSSIAKFIIWKWKKK